jgi:predicted nucleotide-binding protein
MTDLSAEFARIGAEARALADGEADLDEVALSALEQASEKVGRSWSKSSLGYQANVYYRDFNVPPPGHIFSREWGFLGMFHGTVGDWNPYDPEVVEAHVERLAGNPDLAPSRDVSAAAREPLDALIQGARSVAAQVKTPHDQYLKENMEALHKISLPRMDKIAASLLNGTSGQFPIRDMQAAEGGWQVAGHQKVLAQVIYLRFPYMTARRLAEVCERLGRHLEAVASGVESVMLQLGGKVFIGHGGKSKEHLQLGVWLSDEGLEWEVFDREPTAGLSTKERLSVMLDNAQIAFLLMTAEDETATGRVRARENVVHEVGLFQGRLGFTKAIVLLEDGCDEFSNISGIGQIRFPAGNIRAAFDEIRKVLQREGILP